MAILRSGPGAHASIGGFLARVALVVSATTLACSQPESDAPPPEAAPPQGVHGFAPAAVGGTPSVVTLAPTSGGALAASPGGAIGGGDPPTIDQLGLVFTPTTLIARVGEAVVFTNSETLVHNVRLTFTDTDSTVFDVETDPGDRAEFVFDAAGGYDVSCDHHPGMRAFIYATDAEWTVFADNSGAFVVPDVPPGAYTLAVWSVDPALRQAREIRVEGPSTEVELQRP